MAGLEPVRYSYDGDGLLTSVRQGQGLLARSTTYLYDPHRQIPRMEDSCGEGIDLEYDLTGRQTRQVHPDGAEIRFAYDPSGNMTGLTPPGRPASATTYSPLNLPEAFTPPGSAEELRAVYDANKRLTRLQRPGGRACGEPCDAGRQCPAAE